MCGRYALTADPQAIQAEFNLKSMPAEFAPRYNIAPTQPVAVITNDDPETLTFHRWGLIPSWAKDMSGASRMINARAETIDEKPSFRTALKRRRCIIPADGFFEWQHQDKLKIPMFIHLKGQPVFGLAGLWEIWQSPEGEEIRSCTIITTEANTFAKNFHERMPVILNREDYSTWLTPGEMTPLALKPLLKPFDADKMTAYEVSKLVNSPGNDTPDIIRPVA
jgi:putative SOS response-associated peptidase YedK